MAERLSVTLRELASAIERGRMNEYSVSRSDIDRRKGEVIGLRRAAFLYDETHPAESPPVTLATFCKFLEHAIPEEDPEYRVEVTPLTGVELHDAAMALNRMATRPGGHEPVAAVTVRRGGKTFLGIWREVE